MSNMSYCRFTNTRADLQACLDAIRQDGRLSDYEAKAGKWMFEEFLDFCPDWAHWKELTCDDEPETYVAAVKKAISEGKGLF